MEIMQIVGLGLISVILIIILKQQKPEFAIYISLVAGVLIFFMVTAKISSVLSVIGSLADRANIDAIYLNTLLRIIGIAYITEFGSQICKDAGEGAVASKVEFGGKILIMVMAIPILVAILEVIVRLIP
jgi:stage III sporulation protein AD